MRNVKVGLICFIVLCPACDQRRQTLHNISEISVISAMQCSAECLDFGMADTILLVTSLFLVLLVIKPVKTAWTLCPGM